MKIFFASVGSEAALAALGALVDRFDWFRDAPQLIRRAALERFVSLERGTLEKRESLEQLRALEAGMRIDVEIVDSVPLGVDTREDLERARDILTSIKGN